MANNCDEKGARFREDYDLELFFFWLMLRYCRSIRPNSPSFPYAVQSILCKLRFSLDKLSNKLKYLTLEISRERKSLDSQKRTLLVSAVILNISSFLVLNS